MKVHTTLPSKSSVQQIDILQVLRACAVLQIAWFHTSQTTGIAAGQGFGIFGIDVFFVISGFIMSTIVLRLQNRSGPATSLGFLKRRLIRIFPIYWIVALLLLLRKVLSQGNYHLPNYWPSLFLLPSPSYPQWVFLVGFSWTMVFEMMFYYLLSVILLFTVSRAVVATLGVLLLAVAVGLVVGIKAPVLIVVLNPMLLEFTFGVAAALAFNRLGRRRWLGATMVLLGLALMFVFQIHPPNVATSMQAILQGDEVLGRVLTWGAAAGLIVSGSVLWSPRPQGRLWRLLVVMGNASYSAYLLSATVIEFVTRGLRPTLGMTTTSQVIVVSAVMLLGWASYQFIEWPLVHRLQKATVSK